jgi:hypothetical protein
MPGGRYSNPLKVRLHLFWMPNYTEKLCQKLLPILARFTAMEELILAEVSELGVGFNPPGCGNSYMGPQGDERRKEVATQGRRARELAAKGVLEACSQLRTLWVGDCSRAEAVRDEKGNFIDIEWHYEWRDAHARISSC